MSIVKPAFLLSTKIIFFPSYLLEVLKLLLYLIIAITISTLASFITLYGQRKILNLSVVFPLRSVCDSCSHRLSWWQLLPIVGYLIQKGRCHWCHAIIPFFFFLTELITTFTYLWLINFSIIHDLIVGVALLSLLFLVTTDYFAQVIFPVGLLGLLPLKFISSTNFSITYSVISTIFLTLTLFCFQYLTKGIGSGDVYFLLVTNIIWGLQITLEVILIGSLVTIFYFLWHRQRRIAFIPGLAFAFILHMVWSLF